MKSENIEAKHYRFGPSIIYPFIWAPLSAATKCQLWAYRQLWIISLVLTDFNIVNELLLAPKRRTDKSQLYRCHAAVKSEKSSRLCYQNGSDMVLRLLQFFYKI